MASSSRCCLSPIPSVAGELVVILVLPPMLLSPPSLHTDVRPCPHPLPSLRPTGSRLPIAPTPTSVRQPPYPRPQDPHLRPVLRSPPPLFLPQSPFSRSIGRRPDSLVGGRWPSRRVHCLVLGATCLVADRPHNSSRFGAYPLLLHVRRPEELVFARQT